MIEIKTYVRMDEHGVMRVGNTRVMLDGVVYGYVQGLSAETIQQQYPSLTLEEVYGAIAAYLANKAEVEDYLKRQDAIWERERAFSEKQSSPVLQRLRALKAERTALETR